MKKKDLQKCTQNVSQKTSSQSARNPFYACRNRSMLTSMKTIAFQTSETLFGILAFEKRKFNRRSLEGKMISVFKNMNIFSNAFFFYQT